MTPAVPPFAFHQTVYVARAHAYSQEYETCPICGGKLFATLILGSGEHVAVECEYCSLGCDGPRGKIRAYKPTSTVVAVTVTGMASDRYGDGWVVSCSDGDSHRLSDGNVFDNETDAEARRVALLAAAEAEATRNFESRFKTARGKTTWTVGYHRKSIAELERQLEWHRAKLSAPKVRQ